MQLLRICTYGLICGGFFCLPVFAQKTTDIRSYVFGNSLINHLSGDDETTVPHWLYQLAQKAGHQYQVEGQWGFLRNFATDLPPLANWSFEKVPDFWNSDQKPFAEAGFNTILINPTNFIQYQAPDAPYYDGSGPNETPISVTLTTLDWVADQQPDMTYYIYEGWADMAEFINRFPPAKSELGPYYDYNQAASHEWYELYVKSLKKARPDLNIQLIPVAPILAKLLTETPLSDIPVTALYTDDAPHGTASLYFLASLITYTSIYGTQAPEDFAVPDTIHALIRENYPKIVAYIAKQSPIKQDQARAAAPENTPSLAMGLSGISDWSTQHPFIDEMKTARVWIGHLPDQWGGFTASQLEEGGYLDAHGWPKAIPETVTKLETSILTDQTKEATSLKGRYRLRYKGEGTIRVGGRATGAKYKDGEIWFYYTPGEDPVGITIKDTDPNGTGNYIRDISVVQERNIALFDAGAVFNPHWVRRIQDLRALRFMDWMQTNGSTQSKWDARPKVSDYTYTRKGVPLELMVQLANEVGADPWFNMPHLATETYNRNFASYVRDTLSPELKAYVEYSNEMWNFVFPQAQWALKQAQSRWGDAVASDAWMQFSGMRAAEMAQVWSDVFGTHAKDRLVRVIATHTDWPGLEVPLFQAPLWQADGDIDARPPVTFFDAYAVSGYFGHSLGTKETAPKVLGWIEQSAEVAANKASELELSGRAYKAYVTNHLYDQASVLAAQHIKDNSITHLTATIFPYQVKVASDNQLQLIMYEGGTHVVGIENWVDNTELTAFFTHLNYTPEIAQIYQILLKGWRENGGTLFNGFVDVAGPSKWGSWGALRHLDDTNPRWDVLNDFNQKTDAWWSDRPAAIFAGEN